MYIMFMYMHLHDVRARTLVTIKESVQVNLLNDILNIFVILSNITSKFYVNYAC